jgi:hypothetical protein
MPRHVSLRSPLSIAFVLVVAAGVGLGCECDAPATSSPVARDRHHETPTERGEPRDRDDATEEGTEAPRVQSRRRETREDGTQEATEWLSDFARE